MDELGIRPFEFDVQNLLVSHHILILIGRAILSSNREYSLIDDRIVFQMFILKVE